MNTLNYGTFIGRLVKEPVSFINRDGSKNIIITVACRRNFPTGSDRSYESDFIEFKAFLPKGVKGNGIYDYVSTGDKVGIQYSLRSSTVTKDGQKSYYQTVFIESIDILEGRQVREQRRQEKAETDSPKKTRRTA